MRLRKLVPAIVTVAMLGLALIPSAEAQRAFGGGRRGQGQGQGQGRNPAPQEETALPPGEYALEGPAALAAVNRGEGRQALAYYERIAAQAEQQGDLARAARAGHAGSVVALRLGQFQKSIKQGSHAIELFKGAKELSAEDLGAWASSYSQVGTAYRLVGDFSRARQVLEEGLSVARTRLTGRFGGRSEGFLLNALAYV